MLREQPWNVRNLSASDEIAFDRLKVLIDQYEAWNQALERGHSHLAPYLSSSLQDLIHAEYPYQALQTIESNIWKSSVELLEEIQPGKRTDGTIAEGVLQQTSWSQGHQYGKTIFSGPQHNLMQNFSSWILFLTQSLLPKHQSDKSVIIRHTPDELKVELGFCPHSLEKISTRAKDQLCSLRDQWLRGFAYAATPSLILEESTHEVKSNRSCLQRWTLGSLTI